MQKVLAILLVITIGLVFSTVAFAAQKQAATKLERGLKNVAFGWTELPKSILDTSRTSNALVGVTVGTIKGIFQTFARTVSGVIDVATFPVGAYEGPAVKPSMVPETTK